MNSKQSIDGFHIQSLLRLIKRSGTKMEVVEMDGTKHVFQYDRGQRLWKVEYYIAKEYILDYKRLISKYCKHLCNISQIVITS